MTSASVTVRPAVARDRARVRGIECACFGQVCFLFGMWPRVGRPDSYTLIAEVDGEAAGYLIAYLDTWRDCSEMYVGSLGVAPQHRRKGVAQALVRRAMSAHPQLWLHVREGNTEAIALYRKLGMVEALKMPRFYANGETALVLATPNIVNSG